MSVNSDLLINKFFGNMLTQESQWNPTFLGYYVHWICEIFGQKLKV